MGIEAMYSIEFAARDDGGETWYGAGVMILDTGRIFGGDAQYAYVGTYELDATAANLSADARIFRHNKVAGMKSIFGTDEENFSVILEGETNAPAFTEIQIKGHKRDDPSRLLIARARRITELP